MAKKPFYARTMAVIEQHSHPTTRQMLWWCIAREHPVTMGDGLIGYPAAPLLNNLNEPMGLHESSRGKYVMAEICTPFMLVDGMTILHQDTDHPNSEMLWRAKTTAAQFNTGTEISKELRVATLKQMKISQQVADTLKIADEKLWFAVAIVGSIFKEYTVVYPAVPILDENGKPKQLPESEEGSRVKIAMNTHFNLNMELRKYPATRDGKPSFSWEAVDTDLFILRPVLGGIVDHANYQLISKTPDEKGFYSIDLPESCHNQRTRVLLVDEKSYAQLESNN